MLTTIEGTSQSSKTCLRVLVSELESKGYSSLELTKSLIESIVEKKTVLRKSVVWSDESYALFDSRSGMNRVVKILGYVVASLALVGPSVVFVLRVPRVDYIDRRIRQFIDIRLSVPKDRTKFSFGTRSEDEAERALLDSVAAIGLSAVTITLLNLNTGKRLHLRGIYSLLDKIEKSFK